MTLSNISEILLSWYHQNAWFFHVFTLVFFTGLIILIKKRIFNKLHTKSLATKTIWDESFIVASSKPLNLIIWVTGISLAASISALHYDNAVVLDLITTLKSAIYLAAIAWFMIRFVQEVESHYLKRAQNQANKADITTVRAITQLSRLAISISFSLIILDSLGVPTSGVMAAGGLGGIAVGFAAKDLLANIFGGLLVFLDRPFMIGDWVRSPDKSIEGIVEHIGWRTTKIRTFDRRSLYVPNGVFLTVCIENPSQMTNRRIKKTIGVRYEDHQRVAPMLAAIEDYISQSEMIDTSKTHFAKLVNLGDSSLEFLLYCFTKTTNWVKFQEEQQVILLSILEIIHDHGAQCAFPTLSINLEHGDSHD